MTNRFGTSSIRRRRALTLVEVVGGLAILGTLLVALLVARDRSARQWVRARHRVEMTQAADALLTAWWSDASGVPIEAAGSLGEGGEYGWRTLLVPNPTVAQLGGETVRLQVFDRRDPLAPPVTVDVVRPAPPPPVRLPNR